MKAIISINGLIGTFENEKGIELADIVAQVQAQKDCTEIEVRIGNSAGGVVDTGFDIYNYLKSLNKPITTVIDDYCASITSVIFLAGNKRIMKPQAKLMIHTPWGKPEGDADFLQSYSAELRGIEKQLSKIYNQHTNIGEEALLMLMKNETEMSSEEAVKLGFATEIVTQQPIVAYINNQNKMSLANKLKAMAKKLEDNKPLNLTVQDATGKEVIFETENETPQVGDKATIDDAPANGNILMPSGETYVFENGELKEIKPKENANADENQLNKEQIAEMVNNAVTEAMKPVNEAIENLAKVNEKLTDNYVALAKGVKSKFDFEPMNSKRNQKTELSEKDKIYNEYLGKEGKND